MTTPTDPRTLVEAELARAAADGLTGYPEGRTITADRILAALNLTGADTAPTGDGAADADGEPEWFVVVTRTTLDLQPMPAYVLGPYPTEDAARDEAQDDCSITYGLLTIDAKAERYVADDCYWTTTPPADGVRILPN